MISIIICSAKVIELKEIENNISKTIGVEFELIIVDNSNSDYSIFQAYNIGVKKSKFPILCFMHDDIVYHSLDWGKEVENYFKSLDTGMIGVSGTRFLSSIPSIWWAGGHKYFNTTKGITCHNSIDTDRNNPSERKLNIINPENSNSTKVVILDGLWFCIRKSLFEMIHFDEVKYQGFHFYDLDISMQINRLKYDILCIFNIQLEHVSASYHDTAWIKNCDIFYNKWKSSLPKSAINISFMQLLSIEFRAFKTFRNIHVANNSNFSYFKLLRNIQFLNFALFHFKVLANKYI